MICKILDENDIELFYEFRDDENTVYTKENLLAFINEKNCYGFIIKNENELLGFAYGYVHVRPDGRKDFYLHAIDIMDQYQGKGYGKYLLQFVNESIKNKSCRKMFLITNKSNIKACKCYEKTGGISNCDDDIIYEFK